MLRARFLPISHIRTLALDHVIGFYKKLINAGFPDIDLTEYNLIKELGNEFDGLYKSKVWSNDKNITIYIARGLSAIEIGITKIEALGRLWIAIKGSKKAV